MGIETDPLWQFLGPKQLLKEPISVQMDFSFLLARILDKTLGPETNYMFQFLTHNVSFYGQK